MAQQGAVLFDPPPPAEDKSTTQEILVKTFRIAITFFVFLVAGGLQVHAAKLTSVKTVDDRCLVLHVQDGSIRYKWDETLTKLKSGWDPYFTETWGAQKDRDAFIPFGQPLDTTLATLPDSYLLRPADDVPVKPTVVHRKSKVWEASIDDAKPAMQHWLYLELAEPLKRGQTYTLEIRSDTGVDTTAHRFQFDERSIESSAIRIAHTGYATQSPHKVADVYEWMGDGGGRDFSRLDSTPFHLIDTATGANAYSGKLKLRMKHRVEPKFGRDFTKADVWACDFSDFDTPGRYKLVIEGLGSSPPFPIASSVYREAFATAMQGMFYQRMGCAERPVGGFPPPRRPLYRQGVEPAGFYVELTTQDMVTGPNPDDWTGYGKLSTGQRVEPTYGGWADAYDNDQRPPNFVCVFDLLLTYYLTPTAYDDGQLYVTRSESENGIPDILDEALWEIDWWLRMRDDQGGYLTGLCNVKPPRDHNYAGAACGWQGWCVSAGAAMAADCFRLAGNDEQQQKYLNAALEAWKWSEQQTDPMLDESPGYLRGRDLRVTAAAFLYNLTGDESFHQVIRQEHVCRAAQARVFDPGQVEQQYASVGYILSPQPVDRSFRQNMREAIFRQARQDHLVPMEDSPTLAVRWRNGWEGMMQTCNEVSLLAIAHRLTEDATFQRDLERGLAAEAEWTLGRNPLGLVHMTGLTDRSITQSFAPGRRDGHPGLTPGWTPYMCRDGFLRGDIVVGCEWYTNRNYPADKNVWPQGEHYWNSRYSVPNSETTPQQTMRQKIVLYGYLHAIFHHDTVL